VLNKNKLIFFTEDIDLTLDRIVTGFSQGEHLSSTKISTDSVSNPREPLSGVVCRRSGANLKMPLEKTPTKPFKLLLFHHFA
jgi:hypothetical protein